jgi:hypothetical protein
MLNTMDWCRRTISAKSPGTTSAAAPAGTGSAIAKVSDRLTLLIRGGMGEGMQNVLGTYDGAKHAEFVTHAPGWGSFLEFQLYRRSDRAIMPRQILPPPLG